eukprot:9898360-Lingulodinium_polyedra.AAC.1
MLLKSAAWRGGRVPPARHPPRAALEVTCEAEGTDNLADTEHGTVVSTESGERHGEPEVVDDPKGPGPVGACRTG